MAGRGSTTGIHRVPVSITLTTYNRAHMLPGTLESILSQSFSDFELIISDDCSTDATWDVCREFAEKDGRIRYFRNDRNLNMPGNLNAALSRARGEYIATLHDGDVYRRDMIGKWKASLEKHPSAAFVFNHYEVLDSSGRPTGRYFRTYDRELIPGLELILDIVHRMHSPVSALVMARRSVYEDLGGFDPRFGFIADVDMWMRMAARHDAACVLEPLIGIHHRDRKAEFRHTKWRTITWNEDLLCTNMERVFGGPSGPNPRLWRRFFRRWERKVLRWLAGDIYHRRWDSLREGLGFLRGSRSPRLAVLGKLLSAGRRKESE